MSTITGIQPGEHEELELYRNELTGYCYRMLGSGFEADDAVQETMLRVLRTQSGHEQRSSFRTWLYRVATNVCIDMLRNRKRRASPMDLGPASPADYSLLGSPLSAEVFVYPIPDAKLISTHADPSETATTRESVRLALIEALQQLPPRQRAALILCEVLDWRASEVAVLLECSVAAVNSALQRARSTLATRGDQRRSDVISDLQSELLERYVSAFERYDVAALVALLHADVVQAMPPYSLWLEGARSVGEWLEALHIPPGAARLVPTTANGHAAFGIYLPGEDGDRHPAVFQIVEVAGDQISALHSFVSPELFSYFGLPEQLPG